MAIDPESDLTPEEQAARNERDEHKNIFGSFLAGLGAIGIGMAIYKGRRPGGNMMADLLHYVNYGKGGGRGIGLTIKNLAKGIDEAGSAGSAGIRSELDFAISVKDGSIRLDRPDLITDLYHYEELLTSGNWAELTEDITERLKDFVHERFKGANVVPFWGHNLQRITIGEVLADSQTWIKRIGTNEFDILRRAHVKGIVADHLYLDSKLFKDASGRLKDTRIFSAKTVDRIATFLDPFGQGRVVRALFGKGPRVAVLPPITTKLGKTGAQFLIGETLYLAGKETGKLEQIATGLKLRRTGDPLHLVSALRRGPNRLGQAIIKDPEGSGFWAALQRRFSIGTAYASRRPAYAYAIADPLRRSKALASGEAVVYRRQYRHAGSAFLAQSPITAAIPEFGLDTRKIITVPGGGVALSQAEFNALSGFERVRILGGAHSEYEIIKATSLRKHVKFGKVLTEEDKFIPLPRGAAERVEASFLPGDDPGALFAERALTGVGAPTRGLRGKYYATPGSFTNQLIDFANYQATRLNSLASTFGLGIGFKASGNIVTNFARLGAIPLAYQTGIEAAGYADYLAEEFTGVSPLKAVATAYAGARVGQQYIREATGIRAAAAGLESAYPGSIESEGATLARSVILPLIGFITGLKGGYGAGLKRAGLLFALVGGVGISQPASELREEYTGERQVPVRRGALWGLGYQPFFGSDIIRYEPSWYRKIVTDYRTTSIYGSRREYYKRYTNVFGVPFPTPQSLFGLRQLADPYALERRHYSSRPYAQTAGRFDEFPIVGPTLSAVDALIPVIGKRTKKMHVAELMGLPIISSQISDRSLPSDAARRLGIYDIASVGIAYTDASDPMVRLRQQAAIAAEPLGVYKWALEYLGVDLSSTPINQSADAFAIGSSAREFYNLPLGGLFGQTEFPRRFLLSEYGLASRQRQLFNPLRNTQEAWLPGLGSEYDQDYFQDFLQGDPFSKTEFGEGRLPGAGYEALHALHSGVGGTYSDVDRLLILADVAPYSKAFSEYQERVQGRNLSPEWRAKVERALAQRETVVTGLSAYDRLVIDDPLSALTDQIKSEAAFARAVGSPPLQRAWETLTHDILAEIPYIGSKLFPFRDPLERYQKEQIYGSPFADWHNIYGDIVRPAIYDVARANPILGAAKGAAIGALISSEAIGGTSLNPFVHLRSPALAIPSFGAAGLLLSLTRGMVADQNFIPLHKQKEAEAIEYMDRVIYAKARGYQQRALETRDTDLSSAYARQAQQTLIGARSITDIKTALPSGDRRYLSAFVNFPEKRRDQLVAALPAYYGQALTSIWTNEFNSPAQSDEATVQYFMNNAPPRSDSLIWHPSVPTTVAKIRMVQGGIKGVSDNLHRFGFFDSQASEADLRFPNVHFQQAHELFLPSSDADNRAILNDIRRLNPYTDNDTQLSTVHNSYHNREVTLTQLTDNRSQMFIYLQDLLR